MPVVIRKKEICPACGHEYISSRESPVHRRNQITYREIHKNGRLESAIAETFENIDLVLPWRRIDDLWFYPLGFACGAICGSIVYIVVDAWFGPFDILVFWSMAGAGGSYGLWKTHWWLCDEAKQNRKKLNLFRYWQNRSIPKSQENKPIVLEVSHRERDGGSEQGRTIQYFGQLPVDPGDFIEYVKAIMAGGSLAINQWVGSDKPFTRSSYDKLLEILCDSGAVINLGGNKGHQVTTQGKRAFKNYLKQVSN